jgi:SAM-dependent methyltransferase
MLFMSHLESELEVLDQCRVCSNADLILLYEVSQPIDRAGKFLKCGICKCISFYGFNKNIYDSSYYGIGDSKLGGLAGLIRKLCAKSRAEFLTNLIEKTGRCLDIGCGDGDFLNFMKGIGWDIAGTEIAGPAYDRASKRFPQSIFCNEDFSNLDCKRKFHAITFWQVFEHLENPRAVLSKCKSLLEPNGIVAIGVPNPESLQSSFSGKHWLHLDPPRHLHLMDIDGLEGLAKDCGFIKISRRNPWLEFGPIGWIQSVFNIFCDKRDFFFESLKNNWSRESLFSRFQWTVLASILVTPSVVLSIIESMAKRPATYEIYFRLSK